MEKSIGNISNTKEVAKKLSNILKQGDVVFLYGTLGAGKTTFTKLLLEYFGFKGSVTSPTFVLERQYLADDKRFYHLDLYRLKKSDLNSLVFINERDKNGIYLVEWPELIEGIIKPDYKIYLSVLSEKERSIEVINNV